MSIAATAAVKTEASAMTPPSTQVLLTPDASFHERRDFLGPLRFLVYHSCRETPRVFLNLFELSSPRMDYQVALQLGNAFV